ARTHALTRRWAPWSWRRRVAQVASVALAGMRDGVTLVNVHLSAGDAASRRAAEADTVLGLVASRGRPAIVAGDLNDHPGSVVHTRLTEGGLRDTWAALRGDEAGATNWRGWVPATTRPPTQRIDYVLAADDLQPVAAALPHAGDPDFAHFAAISDHLPLAVTLETVAPDD
ncbi:MAG TPA: endonuclease/exonuclease/phosphatase family protein, partial [Acidimicrobiales bacterium]|nr:endonuclease/exonuclease/phosphatase family protein [Acidimicrobiales bacterium]